LDLTTMVELPGRHNRKRAAAIVGAGAIALVVGAFLLIYFVIFPTSSPKPFKLSATPATSSASRYPTATFALSKPATLPTSAGSGDVVHASVTGEATMEFDLLLSRA
jgi:hypothetical protein